MRRVLSWAAGLGLAAAFLAMAAPSGGQTTITLSLVDSSDTSTTVTAVGEDGGARTLRVKAVAASAPTSNTTVTVTVGDSGGTATLGATADYTRGAASVTVRINSGSMEGLSSNVAITPRSDTITENHETIRFTGSTSGSGFTVTPVDLRITDADRTIRLTGPDPQFREGITSVTVWTLWRNRVTAQLGSGSSRDSFVASTSSTYSSNLEPRISWRNGTANHGTHYFIIDGGGRRAILLRARNHSSSIQFNTHNRRTGNHGDISLRMLNGANNTVAEEDRTFEMYVSNPPTGFMGLGQVFAIKDDDSQVELSVDTDGGEEGNQTTIGEGDTGSGVSVSASFPSATTSSTIGSATEVTLSPAVETPAGAGKAVAADFTYSSTADTVSIPARALSSSTAGTLSGLSITDDAIVEGPETFTLGGTSDLGDATPVTLTITDDDADIALSVSSSSVEEGSAADVTVTARFAGSTSVLTTATEVTVTLAAADVNGAAPGTDFTVSGTGSTTVANNQFTISIPQMGTQATGTIRVAAAADNDLEGAEGIVLSGSASVGGGAVGVTGTEMTITQPEFTLSLHQTDSGETALPGIVEGDGGQTVRVRATAPAAVSANTTVTATVGADEGSATWGASNDYTRSAATVPITIATGQLSGYADVTITPRSDTTAEGPETVVFSGTTAGFPVQSADLEIMEKVELTLSGGPVGEEAGNAGAVSVTAAFTGASSSDLTAATDVELSFGAGENTEAADFTPPGSMLTLTIPEGMTSSGGGVALSGLMITSDRIAEGVEGIEISGAAEGFVVEEALLAIADDDVNVTLIADADGDASDGVRDKGLTEAETTPAVLVRAAFTAALSKDLSSDLDVLVTAGVGSPESAKGGGVDFRAPASPVTVTIPSGTEDRWSGFVALTGLGVIDDAVTEGAETFLITGSAPGSTVTPDTLTIAASDNRLEVSVSPETVLERAAAHTITVTAGFKDATSSELDAATTVNVAVAAGDTDPATLANECPTVYACLLACGHIL